MLKISKKFTSKITFIMSIYKNGNYVDYVKGKYPEPEDVLICPTEAIDSDEIEIDSEKCIECLLCPYRFSSEIIEYSEENSFEKFLEFVDSDKKFTTKWIGQAITLSDNNVKCGFEVKIFGGSRSKRIPLLIMIDKKPIILKVVNSFKDIEYGLLHLEEIESLIITNKLPVPSKVIVVNEENSRFDNDLQKIVTKLKETHDFDLVFIETVWNGLKNAISGNSIDWKKIFFPKNM
jgi:hypothetical protein